MMTVQRKNKSQNVVVWAIDPLDREARPSLEAMERVLRWLRKANLELQPVHVLSPADRDLEAGRLPSLEKIEASMVAYLKKLGCRRFLRPKTLVDDSSTRAGAVRALLDCSEQVGAEAVFVSSHGRTGVERLVLGSFAENLLRDAKVPILFMSRARRVRRVAREKERILFPTDFSDSSRGAFESVLSVAAKWKAELVIYHSLVYPVPAVEGASFGASLPEGYFAEQEKWAEGIGSEWRADAEAAGVRASVLVEQSGLSVVTGKSILAVAKRTHAGMVAMASLSGPVARFAAGSAAYELFRMNQIPVWVYGPQAAMGAKPSAKKSAARGRGISR